VLLFLAPRPWGRPNHDSERHTTCLQPHEQLLMGWIMGGIISMT
jgi:hypothetical protein